jgi:hypothetical protein
MIASQQPARPHFHHPLITIATALQYDKLTRLQRDFANFEDDQLLRLLTSSTRDTNSLFFFRGQFYEISTFGANIHYFSCRGRNDTDNYILAFADLDEKYLRRLFTGIELVAFKLCHLAVEGQRRDYHFETERLRQRVKKLKPKLAVPDWDDYMERFEKSNLRGMLLLIRLSISKRFPTEVSPCRAALATQRSAALARVIFHSTATIS